MSTRAGVLNPRARRGVVRASVTRLETKVAAWEDKETLTDKDRQSIVRTLKRLQELNEEFKRYHYSIVELMEDTEVIAEEQKVLDDHENKVEDLIERLEDMIPTTQPMMIRASGMSDALPQPVARSTTDGSEAASGSLRTQKRLRHLRSSIDKAYGTVRSLEPTPDLDVCLVEKMKGDIDGLTKKLSDIVEDILSLPEDDDTSLNEATSVED